MACRGPDAPASGRDPLDIVASGPDEAHPVVCSTNHWAAQCAGRFRLECSDEADVVQGDPVVSPSVERDLLHQYMRKPTVSTWLRSTLGDEPLVAHLWPAGGLVAATAVNEHDIAMEPSGDASMDFFLLARAAKRWALRRTHEWFVEDAANTLAGPTMEHLLARNLVGEILTFGFAACASRAAGLDVPERIRMRDPLVAAAAMEAVDCRDLSAVPGPEWVAHLVEVITRAERGARPTLQDVVHRIGDDGTGGPFDCPPRLVDCERCASGNVDDFVVRFLPRAAPCKVFFDGTHRVIEVRSDSHVPPLLPLPTCDACCVEAASDSGSDADSDSVP